MKRNTRKIVIIALACVVAVGSYFISGTYAKYTSAIAGYDDANVAKWSWTINDTDIDTYKKSIADNAYTIDLMETVYDSDGSSDETDVDTDLFAPGMGGEFDIEITNNSEVNATYAIAFVEEQTNLPAADTSVTPNLPAITRIPIEYSTDNGTHWYTTISDCNIEAEDDATATPNTRLEMGGGNDSTATVTVKWRWAYQVQDENSDPATYTERDTIDTRIGFEANETNVPNVKVTATVTVTQVD